MKGGNESFSLRIAELTSTSKVDELIQSLENEGDDDSLTTQPFDCFHRLMLEFARYWNGSNDEMIQYAVKQLRIRALGGIVTDVLENPTVYDDDVLAKVQSIVGLLLYAEPYHSDVFLTVFDELKREIQMRVSLRLAKVIKLTQSEMGYSICENETVQSYSRVTTERIDREMTDLYLSLLPSEEEMTMKEEFIQEVSTLCQSFTSYGVYCTGSSASNFGTKGSDIDLVMAPKVQNLPHVKGKVVFQELVSKTKNPKYSHLKIKSVQAGRTPIIDILDTKRNFEIDLAVISNQLAVQNTRLLKTYSLIDPRVRPLVLIVKYWAKMRQINSPSFGYISSYSFTLLAIHYLQSIEHPILPSLQQMISEDTVDESDIPEPFFISGMECVYDCRFVGNLDKIQQIWRQNKQNTQSIGELLIGFFNYFGQLYDHGAKLVSIRIPGAQNSDVWNIISVEDPFEVRDLGSVLTPECIQTVIEEFKRGYDILSKTGDVHKLMEPRFAQHYNLYEYQYPIHLDAESVKQKLDAGELFEGIISSDTTDPHRKSFVVTQMETLLVEGLINKNRAINGDRVAVKLLDTSCTPKTAQVVSVLDRDVSQFAMMLLKDFDSFRRAAHWLGTSDNSFPAMLIGNKPFDRALHTYPKRRKFIDVSELVFITKLKDEWPQNIVRAPGKIVSVPGIARDLFSYKRALSLQYFPKVLPKITESCDRTDLIGIKERTFKMVFSVLPDPLQFIQNAISIDRKDEICVISICTPDMTNYAEQPLSSEHQLCSIDTYDHKEYYLSQEILEKHALTLDVPRPVIVTDVVVRNGQVENLKFYRCEVTVEYALSYTQFDEILGTVDNELHTDLSYLVQVVKLFENKKTFNSIVDRDYFAMDNHGYPVAPSKPTVAYSTMNTLFNLVEEYITTHHGNARTLNELNNSGSSYLFPFDNLGNILVQKLLLQHPIDLDYSTIAQLQKQKDKYSKVQIANRHVYLAHLILHTIATRRFSCKARVISAGPESLTFRVYLQDYDLELSGNLSDLNPVPAILYDGDKMLLQWSTEAVEVSVGSDIQVDLVPHFDSFPCRIQIYSISTLTT